VLAMQSSGIPFQSQSLCVSPPLECMFGHIPFSPPKPVSLRDAGFATLEVALGCGFSSARVCVAL